MEVLEFAKKLGAGKHHSARNDDVFIDRLNHKYTVTMMIVFAVIVTTQQYFGSPISCWVPAQFTSGYEKYANDICWIMNTYYVPMEHDIPHTETTRYERMLKYYQWSPFILLLMALCFYFPRMIWRSLNNRSGLDVEKLVSAAMKLEEKDTSNKEEKDGSSNEEKNTSSKEADTFNVAQEKAIKEITDSLINYIENRYEPKEQNINARGIFRYRFCYGLTFWRHRHLSSYIFILFTVVKFLFLANSLIQIILLNAFLGNQYYLFGFEVIKKLVRGLDWGESKRFPRVTLCDFHIREVGIVHRYTVQCVLPINLFNEKIFLILWFWISLLFTFNLFDFAFWIKRILYVDSRSDYIQRKLTLRAAGMSNRRGGSSLSKQMYSNEKIKIKRFVRRYLQEDGCFALRLIARNGQDIIVGEVIYKLYDRYCQNWDDDHTNTDQSIPNSNISSDMNRHASSHPFVAPRKSINELSNNDNERRNLMETTSP